MNLETLGERIVQVRKLRGFSGVDLANKVGIDQSYLSKIEKGKHMPNLYTLCSIAMALNCSIDYLVGNEAYSYYVPIIL